MVKDTDKESVDATDRMCYIPCYRCGVKVYTTEGVKKAQKVTLQCMECHLYYNYTHYGNKQDLGFRVYEEQRPAVEVSDALYFERQLLEYQCSSAQVSNYLYNYQVALLCS